MPVVRASKSSSPRRPGRPRARRGKSAIPAPVVSISLPAWAQAAIVIWIGQLAFLVFMLSGLSWNNYWWCRWLYRPGLRLFHATMGDVLPRYYFSALSPRGAVAGFLVSTLLYTLVLVAAAVLVLRVALAVAPRRAR